MKPLSSLAIIALLAASACKKHPTQAASKGSSGDATGPTNPADASAPKPITGAQIAARFTECWGFRNDGKWDAFKACFTDDAISDEPGSGAPALSGSAAIVGAIQARKVAFPDTRGTTRLELIHGHDVVAVTRVTGMNSGPMKTPDGESPATNKQVGFDIAEVLDIDDLGRIKQRAEYLDTATLLGQLRPIQDHPVRPIVGPASPVPDEIVFSHDDEQETANLLADKAFVDAFNKHDAKAFEALLDNDLTWTDLALPTNLDKAGIVARTKQLWAGFSDLAIAATSQWSAGAYTVLIGDLTGTNDGDLPMFKLKKTGKPIKVPFLQIDMRQQGKLRTVDLFYQSKSLKDQLGIAG